MRKREFLQLAHPWVKGKQDVTGWWMSEKLDGMRAYWDGGATRGIPKINVPWANHAGDHRYVTPPVCTGLWSRYGNVIHAPDCWLDQLPLMPIDGELYVPGFRQHLMSTVKKLVPDRSDWERVKYHMFDSPPFETILEDGRIYNPNYSKIFRDQDLPDTSGMVYVPTPASGFRKRYQKLIEHSNERAHYLLQTQLPYNPTDAHAMIETMCDKVVAEGGEGIMIRQPDIWYKCKRVHSMLKVKPVDDAEGTVVGYTSGRKTDLGSKHLGRMGALILKLECGSIMELSGFTDQEREFESTGMHLYAAANPGEHMPEWIVNPTFPIGSVVTFKYRGKTADGIPAEARYFRKRQY